MVGTAVQQREEDLGILPQPQSASLQPTHHLPLPTSAFPSQHASRQSLPSYPSMAAQVVALQASAAMPAVNDTMHAIY